MTPYRAMLLVVAALVAAIPLLAPPGLVTSFTYIGIDCLVAIGLVLLAGMAGLVSFGQAAFCGIGAYATAKLTTSYGWTALESLPVSLAATAVAALVLGVVTVRLAGHYLVLGTLAWGTGVFYLLGNMPGFGGFNGMIGLPPIRLGTLAFDTPRASCALVWALTGLAFLMAVNLLDSRIGRAIRSLPARTMAESLGVPTAGLKLAVFVVAALLAGMAGWLQAHQIRVVNPGPFNVSASLDDLFMVVIGGIGSLGGALIGPVIFETLQNWLRELLPWLLGRSGSFEMAAFGLLVMLLLQTASSGLMPLLARVLPARPPRTGAGARGRRCPRRRPAGGAARCCCWSTAAVKRFGGLVAVNQVSLGLQRRGDPGGDRAERRGQIDPVQPADRGVAGGCGPDRPGRAADRAPVVAGQVAGLGVARTFQHVLLRPGDVGAGERGAGRAPPGRPQRRASSAVAAAGPGGRRRACCGRRRLQLDRVGIGHLAARPAGQPRAGPAAAAGDRPRAGRRPRRCCCWTSRPPGCATRRKQALAALLGTLRQQGRVDPAGGARHGRS